MLNLTKIIGDEIVKRCEGIKGVKGVIPPVKISRTNSSCTDVDINVEIEKTFNKDNKNLNL